MGRISTVKLCEKLQPAPPKKGLMPVPFDLLHLTQVMVCPNCGNALRFANAQRVCCNGPGGATIDGGIIRYHSNIFDPEMMARDRQAAGYLEHSKFPTQVARIRRFIRSLPRARLPVLDLGCGPGPTTEMLANMGFEVVAVDFSRRSLELNKAKPALYVQADLRDIHFAGESVGGLMMADFLQHLGNLHARGKFLESIFRALVSGGWFFLSCFNVNLKNLLRGDIDGSFADGQIRYYRSTPSEILDILPPTVKVENVRSMNVFHQPILDDIASRLPLSRLFARMIVVTGQKL